MYLFQRQSGSGSDGVDGQREKESRLPAERRALHRALSQDPEIMA